MKYILNVVKNALALRSVNKRDIVLTIMLTFIVGYFSTFMVNVLIDWFPHAVPQSLKQVNNAIKQSSGPILWSFLFGVCIFAPVFEEFLFRGVMWWILEGLISARVAFIVTTILFSLAHLEPLHIAAVFPLGVLFGFLRWRSGSIWLPLLAHFLNNTLASLSLVL